MNKTQRARYLALLPTVATHTAAEAAEFKPLADLAAKHPDASQDVDAPAPAAAAPTLRGFLASMKAGASAGAELIAARAQVATLTTANAALATEVTSARAATTAATAERDTLCVYLGLAAADIAGKKPADITALVTAKISEQSIEVVAGLGVPLGALPAPKGEEVASTAAELNARYHEIATKEGAEAAGKFYAANQHLMFGAAPAKAANLARN